MASQIPPQKNTIYTYYIALVSQADANIFQVNPTLAAGDVTISIDGGAFNNVTALPTAIGAGKVLEGGLTAPEMNGDSIVVLFNDQAGGEWQDAMLWIDTASQLFDDLSPSFPAGANEFTYTITDSVTGLPIEGVSVWFSTDVAGTNIVWSGTTDAFGVARDNANGLPWLDSGTYRVWSQRAGYFFPNPDVEVVP